MNFLELLKQGNLIGAHRGARSIAPENTLRSMEQSLRYCDFIELDVQLSRDEVPVIMHDDTLNRTSNVKGRVCNFTLDELQKFDYGSWYDGVYEPLLTLGIALEFIKQNRIFLNIEIKDIHNNFSDEKVVGIVLKEIQKCGVQDLVIISSFRASYLSTCRDIIPNIPTALLVEDKHPKELLKCLAELKVDAYNMSDELVDKEQVAMLKDAGYFINVYTVNGIARRDELFAMGVTGVFTDFLDFSD